MIFKMLYFFYYNFKFQLPKKPFEILEIHSLYYFLEFQILRKKEEFRIPLKGTITITGVKLRRIAKYIMN